ncbi:MAG: glycogen-binding domain-containing protein, partial [Deltaproteobacteria bacterium]|nr:glycogen-binding domain-containing protein [Deltaproteobacteria bacterium]
PETGSGSDTGTDTHTDTDTGTDTGTVSDKGTDPGTGSDTGSGTDKGPTGTPPIFSTLPPLELDMGESKTVDLNPYVTDKEDADETLVFEWTSAHVGVRDEGDHRFYVVAPVDWFGVDTVALTVRDPAGWEDQATWKVTVNEVTVEPPPPPPDTCGEVAFAYAAGQGSHTVLLSGSFNGWADTAEEGADVLADPDADGTWTLKKVLQPGVHQYKFIVDGSWKADPANPNQTPDGFGGINSVVQVGPCPAGGGS